MAYGATLDGDRLVLDTGVMRRSFLWNGGALVTGYIEDLLSGRRWPGPADLASGADFVVPGGVPGEGGEVETRNVAATSVRDAHLEVSVTVAYGELWVKRVFRLFDGCPAIPCEYYLRGDAGAASLSGAAAKNDGVGNIEDPALLGGVEQHELRLDRVIHPDQHVRVQAVRFFDVTDRNNNLVRPVSLYPYRAALPVVANLLVFDDTFRPGGLYLLKEAPGPIAHHAYPGYDFVLRGNETLAYGIGLAPADLEVDRWIRGYGVVVGVYGDDDPGAMRSIRRYQHFLRRRRIDRDEMVLMNTWGDRGQDTKMSETFALAELEAGARLGVTRLQLDDGWQAGRSSNSAFKGGSLQAIWDNPDYWRPHPERFPKGLGPVVRRARELGIELCLWFNPSADGSYSHWKEDAETLLGFWREFGIRTFKIDGVMIPDKAAEVNLRRMFDRIIDETDGEAVFNLDVTAGRRFGYFTFREYGNLFLENRYTDWSNYYPHWTLRNLWQLSHFVPPQSLQIEFLNVWRNSDRYPEGDPLAPQKMRFEYCFAVTMAAQPLAWFEATGLPEEAFASSTAIRSYREHQAAFHDGDILPIGDEPSGASWTGFQSLSGAGETAGYVEIFREGNDREHSTIRLHGVAGKSLRFEAVCGSGEPFDAPAGSDGEVEFALPERFSYALYRYEAAL